MTENGNAGRIENPTPFGSGSQIPNSKKIPPSGRDNGELFRHYPCPTTKTISPFTGFDWK
jgi:hypothetical protein